MTKSGKIKDLEPAGGANTTGHFAVSGPQKRHRAKQTHAYFLRAAAVALHSLAGDAVSCGAVA